MYDNMILKRYFGIELQMEGPRTSGTVKMTTVDKYKHKFIMFTKSGGQESYNPQEYICFDC